MKKYNRKIINLSKENIYLNKKINLIQVEKKSHNIFKKFKIIKYLSVK